jgi:hypothetical protein
LTDPDAEPGGPKTYRSSYGSGCWCGSGSPTLLDSLIRIHSFRRFFTQMHTLRYNLFFPRTVLRFPGFFFFWNEYIDWRPFNAFSLAATPPPPSRPLVVALLKFLTTVHTSHESPAPLIFHPPLFHPVWMDTGSNFAVFGFKKDRYGTTPTSVSDPDLIGSLD